MSIVTKTFNLAGQINDNPRRIKMIVTDSLATVTTAGYLNNQDLAPDSVLTTDIFDIIYSFNTSTQVGTYGVFLPSITAGVITLVEDVQEGNVLLPVVSGHFANFNGTTGQIKDSGFLPSNAAKTNVVMLSAAPTSGNLANFADTSGTIQDAGIAASAVMKNNAVNTLSGTGQIILVKANGTEAANAVTASGNAGVITTSALTAAGGTTYAITWTNTKITATSVIGLCIQGGTNTTQNITFTCAPGAGNATLTIYNNTAATALNGTILIGYTVF